MLNQQHLKAITDNYAKEMNYRLMRPLTSRFKPNFVYQFPANQEGYIELEADNPLESPLLQFSMLAIQIEYAAIMPSLRFLYENKNVYSVSIPTQMRFDITNPQALPFSEKGEVNVVNGTLDISINEITHNNPATHQPVNEDVVCLMFTFTTRHDNVTYIARIDTQDFLNQVLAATANKEFR